MPWNANDQAEFGKYLVKLLASFDAFNETVGKEVDEILECRIETEVDRVVEKAVDIAVESQVESAMDDYESPLESRVEELEGFVEHFESPEGELTVLHARIDSLEKMLDKLISGVEKLENKVKPKTRWEKLLAWW